MDALRRRPGRDRRRRHLPDPLLQGVPARRRLAGRAGDQLDGRPRLPAVPARRPRRSPTPPPPPATSPTGSPGEFKDTAANNILLQWPIDTDTLAVERRPGAVRRSSASAAIMLFELQMPGDVIGAAHAPRPRRPPGCPPASRWCTPRTTRPSRCSARARWARRTALVSLGTYIAAMVHGHENHQAPATSGPTSPASRTATSTRATACAAACGPSPGSSTCSATRWPSGPCRSG